MMPATSLRTLLSASLLTLAPFLGIGSAQALGPACGKGDQSYVGRYQMSGVMEVGSQLVLRADGSYTFELAYGANDQVGTGCWTQTDRLIALLAASSGSVSGTHTPDTRGFTGLLLHKEGRQLFWRIPGSHMVGRFRRF